MPSSRLKRVAAHDVLALGLAVAGHRDGLDAVLFAPLEELGAGQQHEAEDIDVGEHAARRSRLLLELGQVVAGQPPDQLGRDRDALLRHRLGDRLVLVRAHVLAVAQLERQRRERLQREVVVEQHAVLLEQQHDLLHARVVGLGPAGGGGVRAPGALGAARRESWPCRGLRAARRSSSRKPDVLDAAFDQALEVAADARQARAGTSWCRWRPCPTRRRRSETGSRARSRRRRVLYLGRPSRVTQLDYVERAGQGVEVPQARPLRRAHQRAARRRGNASPAHVGPCVAAARSRATRWNVTSPSPSTTASMPSSYR